MKVMVRNRLVKVSFRERVRINAVSKMNGGQYKVLSVCGREGRAGLRVCVGGVFVGVNISDFPYSI